MPNLFDAIVDVALGLTAPVAPLRAPMFARESPPIVPLEPELALPRELVPPRALKPGTHDPIERTITVERVEHVAAARTTEAPPVASTRANVAQALAPLAPLVAPTSVSTTAVPADRTPPPPVLDSAVTSKSRFSVSVGGTTLVVAGTEPEPARTAVTTPTASRRSVTTNASPAKARDLEDAPRAAAEPTVRVSIGRVDVRAIHSREPAPRSRESATPRSSASLADFLRDRSRSR